MKYKDIVNFELKKINKKQVIFFLVSTIAIIYITQIYDYTKIVFHKDVPIMDTYSIIGWLSIIKISEVVIPVIASISIIYIFSQDYVNNINELMVTYNTKKYNKILLFKWLTIFISCFLLLVITVIIYSKVTIIENFDTNEIPFIYSLKPLDIIIKVSPTLLWYSVFPLLIIVMTKSQISAIALSAIYMITDIFYYLYLHPFGSMINVNSFYLQKEFYTNNNLDVNFIELKNFFLLNRILLVIISILIIIFISKKSLIIKKTK